MSSCRGNTHEWTSDWAAPRGEAPRQRCTKCGKFRCAALTEHKTHCRRSVLRGTDLCKTHQGIEEWAKAQRIPDAQRIADHGAVSEAVVRAMAQGALQQSLAQVSVAVTGVAGPAGGSPDKPVGTVWFAWSLPSGTTCEVQHFGGDRATVRAATVLHALQRLNTLLEAKP